MKYDDWDDWPQRKARTSTARHVAAFREASRYDPATYAVPLAVTLATLSEEYERVGNVSLARRHLSAAARAMRRVMQDDTITLNRRRRIVAILWRLSHLYFRQNLHGEALKAIDEALYWDAVTWDAHEYEFRSRELGRAHMLELRATMLDFLGLPEQAVDARAQAILTALSDPDLENDEVSEVAARFALEAACSKGFAEW